MEKRQQDERQGKQQDSRQQDSQASRQQAQGSAVTGIHTGSGRDGGFLQSAPESNVGPAGAAQTSRGSAADTVRNSQSGVSGSASGGEAGASKAGAPAEHDKPIGSLADDKPSM
ncbi:hypothetical protein [uncultured Massilia sp.]|uniref:hypothetical protein n=1 Tax=uncultured Massilia sp. TaxID=169973 RepID=UPI0025FD4CC4|nr:hypothetical protein [uncultured Massilia sp.]